MLTHTPAVTLNNGVAMPVVGFGVYAIAPDDTERAVSAALEAGYRSIDTAAAYQNEEAVARAVAASGIPRDELFITTKLWVQDAGEASARRAFETSLTKLGLDRIDLYLIHQPFNDYYGSWRAMEDIYREGLARAIGVSNFHPDRLVDLIEHNEIVPAVDQIETHPYFQRTADQAVLADHGVRLEAWGPLAQGGRGLLQDPVLIDIAAAHDKTVAQMVLGWLIQRDAVVIPKSVNPQRMRENLDIFDVTLSDDEMARIASLDAGLTAFDQRDPANVDAINHLTLT